MIDGAALVITGEGSLDSQTLHGKAPAAVAARCRAGGVPVIAVVGQSTLSASEASLLGFQAVHGLRERATSDEDSRTRAEVLLAEVGWEIGQSRAAPWTNARTTPREQTGSAS